MLLILLLLLLLLLREGSGVGGAQTSGSLYKPPSPFFISSLSLLCSLSPPPAQNPPSLSLSLSALLLLNSSLLLLPLSPLSLSLNTGESAASPGLPQPPRSSFCKSLSKLISPSISLASPFHFPILLLKVLDSFLFATFCFSSLSRLRITEITISFETCICETEFA